ncbi:MAG TPA: methylmalonyl-CoA epimerase [Rubricoccaceae bacterium]|nr:methylmalonyl-CoA epimerase [Rubricoccaceae bacterium]
MTLEHLGIAVADADAAVALFERLLGAAPYKRETVEREGVRTIFFGDGGREGAAPKLELLEALSPASPVAKYLDKRGPGLHHVAFEVADVEAEVARLRALGFQPLADAPKPGADGKRIVFLHPRSTGGVLVELCESVWAPERLDVPFEGGTLFAFVSGPAEAPPLVVLHGADDELSPLVRRWARRFRVIALADTTPAVSAGARPSGEAFVASVPELLDHFELAITACFGYATGGTVALQAAARHPERFGRLAVYDARVPEAPEEEAALATLAVPTLVACGDAGPFLAPALHLHATLPQASLAVLPGMEPTLSALAPADLDAFADLVSRHLTLDA